MRAVFATLLFPFLALSSPLHPEIKSGVGSRLAGNFHNLWSVYAYPELNMVGNKGSAYSCAPGSVVTGCSPFRDTPNGLCQAPLNGVQSTIIDYEPDRIAVLRGPFKSVRANFDPAKFSGIWL